jgi:hypothetical protein
MKNYPILIGFLLISIIGSAQRGGPGPSAGREKKTEQYTLTGFRHGVNFFPRVKLEGVQYESTDTLGFDRYHSLDVIYDWLRKWQKEYPDLVDLYEVGKSYEGRPVLQMTLTNSFF